MSSSSASSILTDSSSSDGYTRKNKDFYVIKNRKKEARRKYNEKLKNSKKAKLNNNFIPTTDTIETISNEVSNLSNNFNHENRSFHAKQLSTDSDIDLYENQFIGAQYMSSTYSEDSTFTNSDTDDSETEKNNSASERDTNGYIYPGSSSTLNEFAISLLLLKYKHKFSETALDDILRVFQIVLPKGNSCPKSFKSLSQILNVEVETKNYLICSNQACEALSEDEKSEKCIKCNNELIHFSIFNILTQLKKILNNNEYFRQIREANTTRTNSNSTQILNAFDGSIYSNLPKNNSPRELTISLNINSDGAPLVKSRSFSLWPLLGTIVELNQSSREKFDNIIIFGIWLNSNKPPQTFFEKAIEQLINLQSKTFKILDYDIKIRCQAALFDLPAKAMILRVKQFNGQFGCISCFHPGQRVGNLNVYPLKKIYNLKTNEDYKKYSAIANILNETKSEKAKLDSVFGFFGSTKFEEIIKIPEQVPFDFMHLVLQGHAKWLFNKFFFEKDSDDLYLGNKVKQINKLLGETKLPHIINRKPTKIDDVLRWKSSEIKNFLFYYSIPIFMNTMPSWYFYRYAAYVIAIRLLYEPINNINDLDLAEEILLKYINDLDDTFSISAYTYTIHAHLHLVDQVKLHGPLQSHSQFCFEGSLINLINMLHGTRGYINQIGKQLFLSKDLKDRLNENEFENEELLGFIRNRLEIKDYASKEIICLLGTVNKKKLSSNEKIFLENKFQIMDEYGFYGDRLSIKNKVYHSKNYSRKGKSNSYSVSYLEKNKKNYCDIEYFFEIEGKFYAKVTKHEIFDEIKQFLPNSHGYFYDRVINVFQKYFKIIDNSNNFDFINCENILNRCIITNNNNNLKFITELAYEFEHD